MSDELAPDSVPAGSDAPPEGSADSGATPAPRPHGIPARKRIPTMVGTGTPPPPATTVPRPPAPPRPALPSSRPSGTDGVSSSSKVRTSDQEEPMRPLSVPRPTSATPPAPSIADAQVKETSSAAAFADASSTPAR
ncbi:MAG: hypothetical protein HUU21_28800, partial [Polyangiaceae bacterium]|nr:hypothetical protein [Polyangiaceae bacterium]